MKTCYTCKQSKSDEMFIKRSLKYSSGLRGYCKACHAVRTKAYVAKNLTKTIKAQRDYYNSNSDTFADKNLQKKYNITLQEYNTKLASQGGVCKICKQPETGLSNGKKQPKRLSVDHDHTTKKNRDLLCHTCNLAVGYVHDNFETAISLAKYIQEHGGVI